MRKECLRFGTVECGNRFIESVKDRNHSGQECTCKNALRANNMDERVVIVRDMEGNVFANRCVNSIVVQKVENVTRMSAM
jgi:hypothetical protein